MDPTLTWEILSRLASSQGADDDPPFFAQREAAASARSMCSYDLFFSACPIIRGGCFPAVYSRESIGEIFLNILKLHHGRMSTSEMSTWLGMEEDKVSLVGEWLCHRSNRGSDEEDGRAVCKVYNPIRQQHEYAINKNLRLHLQEIISKHCYNHTTSAISPTAEYCPSLQDMANSFTSSKICELVPAATVTMKQFAQEMELTCDDVESLLKELNSDVCIDSKLGVVYNSHVGNRMQYLERQVLGALSGVTVPTSVCFNEKFVILFTVCHYPLTHCSSLPLLCSSLKACLGSKGVPHQQPSFL